MKTVYMTFTILHAEEVEDDFTEAEAFSIAEEYAQDIGIYPFINDIEVSMC